MPHGFHPPHHKSGQVALSITSLNENGYGVGQKSGQTLTVARTAPGDQVLVAPRGAARWVAADLIKLVKPGVDRVASGCAAFDQGCGGCQWRHLSYLAQLSWKEKNLVAALRSKAGYNGLVQPMVALEAPEAYRNKLSLKNTNGRWLFLPETEGESLSPRHCPVQTPPLQKAWETLRSLKAAPGIEQLHLRSNAAGQVGLHVFVTERVDNASLKSLFEAVGGVGLGATSRSGYRVVAGEVSLTQTIGGTTWRIPHNGFYQTNGPLAPALLETMTREAKLTTNDRLLDLYCGAGFFGVALATQAREVVGIEENPQSVEAATANAAANGVRNARFVAGDLGAVLADIAPENREVAVVDPPREGLLPRALQALIARAPSRIVYVSCAPASLVRDLKVLLAAGWRGVNCVPVDMFPHSSHLEVIVTLERVSGSKTR
jgi:23S rRNA (uracil1939-C5)-methyltransferase